MGEKTWKDKERRSLTEQTYILEIVGVLTHERQHQQKEGKEAWGGLDLTTLVAER